MNSQLVARNLARFKLVTFDVTDTLLKFSRPPEIQYALAARQNGCTIVDERALARGFRTHFKRMTHEHPNFGKGSNQDWRWWWRSLVIDIFRESHPHIDEARVSRVADQLIEDYGTQDCWTKIDKADEIIEMIRAHGKRVGIISNFDPRLRDIIETMCLPRMDFVLTSYEAGVQKPSSRIFKLALSQCGTPVRSREALHIGNTPKLDYIGAKQAGWASVLVNAGLETGKEVSLDLNINPKHVFKNFKDFIHVLKTAELNW